MSDALNGEFSIGSSRRGSRTALLVLAVVAALPSVAATVVLVAAALSDIDLPGEVDMMWRFAVMAAAAAVLGGASAWLVARRASLAGPWSARTWLWLVTGAGLAAFAEASLRLATIAEFGYFDAEFVGITLALPWAVAALTIGAVARSANRGLARYASSIIVLVAATVCLWLTVVSFPDAFHEMTPDRWPWPLALAGVGTYAIAAVASAIRFKPASLPTNSKASRPS